MAVVVPIDGHEIVSYIFEIAEQIPNDFYINIMDLMKKYYESSANLNEIHEYLNSNEDKVDHTILNKIRNYLTNETSYIEKVNRCTCTININCFQNICECGAITVRIMIYLVIPFFFAAFIGGILWALISKK